MKNLSVWIAIASLTVSSILLANEPHSSVRSATLIQQFPTITSSLHTTVESPKVPRNANPAKVVNKLPKIAKKNSHDNKTIATLLSATKPTNNKLLNKPTLH